MKQIGNLNTLYQMINTLGIDKSVIDDTQQRLQLPLPKVLVEFYGEFGSDERISRSFNRIAYPDELQISHGYLLIAHENQHVCHWGIKKDELTQDNPSVYVCYDIDNTANEPSWYLENKRLSDFLLMTGLFNGTMGGLDFHANYLGGDKISGDVVDDVISHWQEITDIQVPNEHGNHTRYFTQDFLDILVMCFSGDDCTALFVGTNHQQQFDKILSLDVDWSYISDEDD